jgi:hypothetical protein
LACVRASGGAVAGMSGAAVPRGFPPVARETLVSWFSKFASSTKYEIEFRVQDVGAAGFERVLKALSSHAGWSNAPVSPVVSLDIIHMTQVRETKTLTPQGFGPSSFLLKEKGPNFTFTLAPSDHTVRFAVSQETETSADTSDAHTFRHKQRWTFEHRGLFKFELTQVKQGPSDQAARKADTQYEVELEFCGHLRPEASRAEYLADSMLMKAADLVRHLANPSGTSSEPGASVGDGITPQECDEISISPGTEVMLASPGHGAAPRFSGEMPADFVQRVRWLFSHREPDGRVYVMSEPSMIMKEHYPLFYFCGTVPFDSVRRRGT